jgi:hypothetical protein
MEHENNDVEIDVKKYARALGLYHIIEERLIDAGRRVLLPTLALMGIWVIGRVLEAYFHRTVFEPIFIYCISLSVWILLGVFVFGAAVDYMRQMKTHLKDYSLIISWAFFALLISFIIYYFQGFKVASIGLFSIISGLTEPAQQSFVLLFKSFPVIPLLPVNLVAAKVMGTGLEIDSLMPFVLSASFVFGFFVWSIVYGIFLLKFQGERDFKIVHLSLASAGMIIIMVIKSISSFADELLIYLQAGTAILLLLQILLTYSCLRFAAIMEKDEDAKEEQDEQDEKPIPLPPSALKVAFFILLILPVLADIQSQFTSVSNGKTVLQELESNQKEEDIK